MLSLCVYMFMQRKMPGRGQKDMSIHKAKMRRIKAKHQRKRFMRAKDPVLAVFMWGVQHTVRFALYSTCIHLVSFYIASKTVLLAFSLYVSPMLCVFVYKSMAYF